MPNIKKKEVSAVLIKNENSEIVIKFDFNGTNSDLNLQSNSSDEIKKVFLELTKEIRSNPIKIKLTTDKAIDAKKDNLFIEAANEYINQLNNEMLVLENDEDLKTIRKFKE
jgi:hypothetical protein